MIHTTTLNPPLSPVKLNKFTAVWIRARLLYSLVNYNVNVFSFYLFMCVHVAETETKHLKWLTRHIELMEAETIDTDTKAAKMIESIGVLLSAC